ncbi:MAG: transcription antitermination factor NusB [Bdellovibrionales bacterium]|nr:transcription antitermination factor NusB [Bdellovibrionales bacterium]
MSADTARRRAREVALQVLFQMEFVPDIELATRLDYFRMHLDITEDAWAYAEQILQGIEKHKQELDNIITEKSRNWKISRMAPVDLCLLRIGVYELSFGQNEVPPKVAINEAIEIAKRFSGTESSHFINGILDDVLRTNS